MSPPDKGPIPFEPDPRTDIELWQIVDKMWAIPVYVRWGWIGNVSYVEAIPAVGLSYEQSGELANRIKTTKFLKLNRGYAVYPSDFRGIARRCHGITPDRHFIWNVKVGRAFDGIEETAQPNTFLEHLVTHCKADVDPDSVRMVWIVLCNLLPEWLLSGKPVKFGDLFSLVAMPLRKNWRQILLARAPGLRKVYLTRRAVDIIRIFFSTAGSWLRSPELMETSWRFGGSVCCRWNIFIRQGKAWDDIVYEHENAAMGAVGHRDYLLRWSHFLNEHEEEIHQMGCDELSKENAASGRVVTGGPGLDLRLVRNFAPILIPPKINPSGSSVGTVVDDFADDPKSLAHLEKTAARLLSLSPSVPTPVDVRGA